MSTTNGPYLGKDAVDLDDTGIPNIAIETTLIASQKTIAIDTAGNLANVEVFNGEIPGPTFRLNVGDTAVIRLINELPYQLGIHWHGVELENYSDGTEVTQGGAAPAIVQTLGDGTLAGGTFLYKFKATRPGIFWYHPHHGNSVNRLFHGLYGMIIVTDPLESTLPSTVLPTDSMQLVLSDITVCKVAGSNDTTVFDPATFPTAEWLGGTVPKTGTPHPVVLCEIGPAGSATNDDGTAAAASYGNHDVPSLMRSGRMVEGQKVLTNGLQVEARGGTPGGPPAAFLGSVTRDVTPGQGLRLQIVNCAHVRYFRLFLSNGAAAGGQLQLLRIGGEGGLLDAASLDGGFIGSVDTQYTSGEIVLGPGMRADVVANIPTGLPTGTVLTLWTRAYPWTGEGFSVVPTVPVAHLKLNAGPPQAFSLSPGTALRGAGAPVEDLTALGVVIDPLLNPAPKAGNLSNIITVNPAAGTGPNFDNALGMDLMMDPITKMPYPRYTDAPHIANLSRFAEGGKIIELKLNNTTGSHHPFHLHGFSFQPTDIRSTGAATGNAWPRHEFMDVIDLFPGHTVTIRVPLRDRELAQGTTLGGMFGRWLFHCHLFFHHARGMIGELVVTDSAKREKPNVNVDGSWAYTAVGGIAKRTGTFFHRDGLAINLTSNVGPSPVASPGGTWTWDYPTSAADPVYQYVYITATDTLGKQDQAVFKLQTGGTATTAWDTGDPHILTTDGTRYDFQAAGEFILLRDRDGMEIQVRQTPALTAQPIADDYTGLTECVSLNTAVAARVGPYRISYQPGRDEKRLMFFLNREPAEVPRGGLDLGEHRVTTFDAGGQTGLRVDYAHGPVLMVTPQFWSPYGLWYLDINITNTNADEGLMGRIAKGSWLPILPDGSTVGPRPASAHDRYITLYRTFADAWRLTDFTSMFVYFQGKSTKSFTDLNWPAEKLPCSLAKGFPQPANPIRKNIPVTRAKAICKGVTLKDLNAACVFDVATTGDPSFARGYEIAQDLRLRSTAVQIMSDKPQTSPAEPLVVTAIVLPQTPAKTCPTGSITFIVDGVAVKPVKKLDRNRRARLTLDALKAGKHTIRAVYTPGGRENTYHSSSSPNLLHTVTRRKDGAYTVTETGGHMMPMGLTSRGSDAGRDLRTTAKRTKTTRTRKKHH